MRKQLKLRNSPSESSAKLFRVKRTGRTAWFYGKLLLAFSLVVMLFLFWNLLPNQLFNNPTSTVLEDRDGKLLSARIADDGQWRFPEMDSVPKKFALCLIYFEDQHFRYHPGINPVSVARAAWQNISEQRVVSGASTITMQVARMSRNNHSRSVWQKLIEIGLALRLEIRFSKDEILAIWASNAPMGGNVVGLEAASWRYYRSSPTQLSWAEAATLAVLPNAPSLIYPGKNSALLKAKRNRLLKKLCNNDIIDRTTLELAMAERLPGHPSPLPNLAPHLCQRAISEGKKGQRIRTTINRNLQKAVTLKVARHQEEWSGNQVHNAAALVLDNSTGEVLAYVGNAVKAKQARSVDIITSRRSTGSILKPFLYADMMQNGSLLPQSLVPDIPTDFSGYVPKNFSRSYDGAVPADVALTRSLNIPAVHELRKHGLEKFHSLLQKLGVSEVDKNPDYYGLSLILGGAECTLWSITSAYGNMSRAAQNKFSGGTSFHYVLAEKPKEKEFPIDRAAAYLTMKTLRGLTRPSTEGAYAQFTSHRPLAWKTGTSFGMRDAWAIGTDPKFSVGVWVGNATGEGRPKLTGIRAAAPLLFEINRILPAAGWFDRPTHELAEIEVCSVSGFLATTECPTTKKQWVHPNGERVGSCSYHRLVTLNAEETKRVNSDCYPVAKMVQASGFVLPPLMAWYYAKKHPSYKGLPEMDPQCALGASRDMAMIYPRSKTRIKVPKNLDGSRSKAIFEATHTKPNATIYWHLDNHYIGSTQGKHRMELDPSSGEHFITLVDQMGGKLKMGFVVVGE